MRDPGGRIAIAVPPHANFRLFDDHGSHGINWLRKVDFVVEEPSRYLFIELKDYENPGSSPQTQSNDRQRFFKGAIDQELCEKFVDSYFYETAAGRADKPVDYYILAETRSELRLLNKRSDALLRQLPRNGPMLASGLELWKRPFLRSLLVLNVEQWNHYLPDYPVSII